MYVLVGYIICTMSHNIICICIGIVYMYMQSYGMLWHVAINTHTQLIKSHPYNMLLEEAACVHDIYIYIYIIYICVYTYTYR